MYALMRCAANVALRALASAPDGRVPFALIDWVTAQLDGQEPLLLRVRERLTRDLIGETALACGLPVEDFSPGGLADAVEWAGDFLPTPQAAAEQRRAWWTNWLSKTLDRTYALFSA